MGVQDCVRCTPVGADVRPRGCSDRAPVLELGGTRCILETPVVSGGAIVNGCFKGQRIGSGTGVWQMSDAVRAGKMSMTGLLEAEACMNRSRGHCLTMGAGSTMASMVEALGMGLPHHPTIPAAECRR